MAEHATQAVLGHGTKFERGNGDGPPETFTTLHEVIAFDAPDEVADDIEVTHFESPNKTKEYIRGLIEAGEMSFTVNYNPAQYTTHTQIITDKGTGTAHNYRFVLPDSLEKWTFSAYVKGTKLISDPNEAQQLQVTLKVAGAVTVS
jgi:hypothetical protein